MCQKRLYIVLFALISIFGKAQVSILSAGITPYNITPRGMLDVSIMNPKSETTVVLEAKLLGPQNEVLLSVTSAPFTLKNGLNNTVQMPLSVATLNYGTGDRVTQLKTSKSLSSGKYNYCASINAVDVADEYCQDLEAESSAFLFLVFPPDKETIETKHPVLTWTHSEGFSNSQKDFYRIIVTELNPDQSPEAAINTNIPVYMKNLLTTHQVQYPVDAKDLVQGKKYAWQVQKISNGAIANKTEAWEFKIKAPDPIKENKYATLKKVLDGTLYKAEGNKIFFRFDEGYTGSKLTYRILNEKQEPITAQESDQQTGEISLPEVKSGYNTFTIDLNNYKIAAGVYTLEVVNEKREVYKLKFAVE